MALPNSVSVSPNYAYNQCSAYSCPSYTATYGVPYNSGNGMPTCNFQGTYNPTGLGNQAVNMNCYYQNGQFTNALGNGELSMCAGQLACTGGCYNGRHKFDNMQCGSCPSSYSPQSNSCTYTCPTGNFVDPTSTSMPPTCSPCSSFSSSSVASYAVNSAGQCAPTSCQPGYGYDSAAQTCTACDGGSISATPTSACSACPAGQAPVQGGRTCTTLTCAAGSGVSNGSCQPCSSSGGFFDPSTYSAGGAGAVCEQCPGTTVPNDASTGCVQLTCDPGYGVVSAGPGDPFGAYCENCDDGSASPGGTSPCVSCDIPDANGFYYAPNADGSACVPLVCASGQGAFTFCQCFGTSIDGVCQNPLTCYAYCDACTDNTFSPGGSKACQTCESPLVVSSDNSACNVPPSIKARRARRDAQMRATSRGEMSDPAPQPFRRKKRFDTWA